MTTHYNVICNCGHEGKITLKENDTPYSPDFWEKYSLKDLNGGTYSSTGNVTTGWATILQSMNATCPKCNAAITPDNVK